MNSQAIARPWPTADEIAEAHVLGAEKPREWSCFDLSDCRHTASHLIERDSWTIDVCDACGYTTVTCNHQTCEWNTEGTLLRCTTCGIDAT